jgi:hypothetical protein
MNALTRLAAFTERNPVDCTAVTAASQYNRAQHFATARPNKQTISISEITSWGSNDDPKDASKLTGYQSKSSHTVI